MLNYVRVTFQTYPLRYIVTIFLSAFLLFQVQPMIAKFILPWFGGTPAVWTTCMLFFQVLLLVGYAYAHLTTAYMTPKSQSILHIVLLVVALAFLPIIPAETWKPAGDESPILRILTLLGATIGLPYMMLSTTGPLMQRWFSLTNPGDSPYRLFALSNAGSLVALLSYPFVFEPALTLGAQAYSWSSGFGLFVVACGVCAFFVISNKPAATPVPAAEDTDQSTRESSQVGSEDEDHKPTSMDMLTWLGLAAAPSILLLATTNQMCQEVAVVPFLWIIPLSLYLITFIICFDKEAWYHRPTFGVLGLGSAVAVWYCLDKAFDVEMHYHIAAYSAGLFFWCMVCHGELSKSKPAPKHLTLFFLIVSAGGAIGGVFVVVIAPRIFDQFWELHTAYTACFGFTMLAYWRSRGSYLFGGEPLWAWSIVVSAFSMLTTFFWMQATSDKRESPFYEMIERSRDFFGVLTVYKDREYAYTRENGDEIEYLPYKTAEYNYGDGNYHALKHGAILHGTQYVDDPEARQIQTTYYATQSGVGIAVRLNPKQLTSGGLKIGVVGLGTGTMAAYGTEGDEIVFYEINPQVVDVAEQHFTYLKDSRDRGCKTSTILGDARIQMERQLANGDAQKFDVLVVDAFSSDAIPMHLLTLEAFALYKQHLAEGGILAVHISNRFLDLDPIVRNLADKSDLQSVWVDWGPTENENKEKDPAPSTSSWILVTNNQEFLDSPLVTPHLDEFGENPQPNLIWTDNFGSLWQVLR